MKKKPIQQQVEIIEEKFNDDIFELIKIDTYNFSIDETSKFINSLYIYILERRKADILDYTLAILKPNIVASQTKSRAVVERLKKENFDIYDIKLKTLTKEEIMNLYYKHTKQTYFDDVLTYNTKGPSALLILINKNPTYIDSNSMEIRYPSPIHRWKDLIGPKNPLDDKNKTTLRGSYGLDITQNCFYGSDNVSDAYKEISCFYFSLPVKAPDFAFNINKVSISTLMRFLFPLIPNHPDVSGRLDLFALYGPVKDYHKLDICFCINCKYKLRKELIKTRSMMLEVDKILSDEYLSMRLDLLCDECSNHVLHYSHLFSGEQDTHIYTDQEIDIEVENLNSNSILRILESEKGSSARTILSKINVNLQPKEITYTKDHIKELLKNAETDYYDRFDYQSLQNLILEDRRIRLNFWIGKIIGKPTEKFRVPQLINPLTKKEISDMKSHKFTLLRTDPIIVKNSEEEELKQLIILHPLFIKIKLSDFELKNLIVKLFNRNFYKIATKETKNNTSMVSNLILMRNFDLQTMKHRGKVNYLGLKKLEA